MVPILMAAPGATEPASIVLTLAHVIDPAENLCWMYSGLYFPGAPVQRDRDSASGIRPLDSLCFARPALWSRREAAFAQEEQVVNARP